MRRFVLAAALVATAVPSSAIAQSSNDQMVADQIANNLKTAQQLSGYEISVKYREGTARLEGWVRDQQQMDEALAVVGRTPQVERVINRLEVQTVPAPVRPVAHNDRGQLQPQPQPQMQAPAPMPPQTFPNRSVQGQQGWNQQAPQMAGRPTNLQPVRHAAMPNTMRQPVPGGPAMGGPMPGGPMPGGPMPGGPVPEYAPAGGGPAPAMYDQPYMPNYAWPSYAAYPNYAALTYPKQYSPTAWPYIGPFYPYPQVPLGWRKVTLEWDDGWWFLDFNDSRRHCGGR